MHPPNPSTEFVASFDTPIEQAKASTGVRILAVAGGLVALLAGSIVSFGLGLVAMLGFGIVALVWRARGARLTRRATWIGAVLAVALSFGTLIGVGLSLAPGGIVENMQTSMDQANRAPPPPIVERMRRLGPPQNQRVQSEMDSLTRSKAFVLWTLAMTMTLGSLFFGLLVGTPAWGCAMLIGYGVRGRWPMPRPEPQPAVTSPVRLPLIVP